MSTMIIHLRDTGMINRRQVGKNGSGHIKRGPANLAETKCIQTELFSICCVSMFVNTFIFQIH